MGKQVDANVFNSVTRKCSKAKLLPCVVIVFLSGAWGTCLDFGGFLQCSSTSAPRMGHVCVCDSFLLLPSLPGLVPLWYGDSD